jgi:hypothetical protein
MPKTKFSNGIIQGKLMAKEYEGVLLLIATILRSTSGSNVLKDRKGTTFSTEDGINDWVTLVETLLMWVQWLKSDEMPKKLVKRSKKKHQFLMYLIRKVGDRQKGMGLRITKFHAISHMSQDILHFGVPLCFDTGPDEAMHKPTKVAAKVTQKRKELFDEQVGLRMMELHTLQLGMAESKEGSRKLWDYYFQTADNHTQQPTDMSRTKDPFGHTFGFTTSDCGRQIFALIGRGPTGINNSLKIVSCFVEFAKILQQKLFRYVPNLLIYSSIIHNNVLYRSTECYHKEVWRDWVMINWEEHGLLPSRIWGFVNLCDLPTDGCAFDFGGIDTIFPGNYAIIESSNIVKGRRGEVYSEISYLVELEVEKIVDKMVTKLRFYLAHVESFHQPLVVVPDIDGPANRYIVFKERSMWKDDFAKWLARDYEKFPDFEDDLDEEEYLNGEESGDY